MDERRCEKRVRCEMPATISTVEGATPVRGVLVDVTEHGMRLKTGMDISIDEFWGEQLFVSLNDRAVSNIVLMVEACWVDDGHVGLKLKAALPLYRRRFVGIVNKLSQA